MRQRNILVILACAVIIGIIILVSIILNSKTKTLAYNPFSDKTTINNIYLPEKTNTVDPTANVIMDYIQLITPEDKVGENITTDKLASFCKEIEKITKQAFIQNNSEFTLMLQVTINPKETYNIEITTNGEVSKVTLQELYNDLQTLPPMYSKSDPIVFLVAFTVKPSR
jgi:hypothetical protein